MNSEHIVRLSILDIIDFLDCENARTFQGRAQKSTGVTTNRKSKFMNLLSNALRAKLPYMVVEPVALIHVEDARNSSTYKEWKARVLLDNPNAIFVTAGDKEKITRWLELSSSAG